MAEIDRDKLIRYRQDGARQVMERLNLDLLVVSSFDNVRYVADVRPFFVTGWMPNAVAVLARHGDPVALYPDEYVAPSPYWVDGGAHLKEKYGWNHYTIFNPAMVSDTYVEWMDWAFQKLGITAGRVGLDSAPWQWFVTFKERFPKVEIVDAHAELLRQRAIKSPEEIALLRDAALVSGEAVMRGLSVAQEGARDLDVLEAAMGNSFHHNSEGDAFFPFLTCGPVQGGALYPVNREIRKGDPVILDLGPIIDGYMGDCMRVEYVGKPTSEFEDLYRTVYDCMYAGIKTVRPGTKASEIDAAVRNVMRERGYPDHRFDSGHGVGLSCCELPIILRADAYKQAGKLDMTMQPGMVFTLEPRLYKPLTDGTFIQASLEEIVLVTDGGCEVLTSSAPFLDIVEPQPKKFER